MEELEGRTAVVTGAAGGIGYGIAAAAAAAGMAVALADIDGERVAEAAARLAEGGATAEGFAVDVSDPASVDQLRDAVMARFGQVDLLCNNAGVGLRKPLIDTSADDWQWVFSINVFGVVNGLRSFIPVMAGGPPDSHHVVNTSSMSGVRVGVTGQQTMYVGSKFAVVGLSEALRPELEPLGIGLSVFLPGPFRTEMGVHSRRAQELQGRVISRPAAEDSYDRMPVDYRDPMEAGPLVIEAVRRNLPFVVSHPQFWPQVAGGQERLRAAFAEAATREGIPFSG
jgi:NAD(P)-dependent dehydrogenase (short-subunit alcohol dehydrogenase family)